MEVSEFLVFRDYRGQRIVMGNAPKWSQPLGDEMALERESLLRGQAVISVTVQKKIQLLSKKMMSTEHRRANGDPTWYAMEESKLQREMFHKMAQPARNWIPATRIDKTAPYLPGIVGGQTVEMRPSQRGNGWIIPSTSINSTVL